MANQKFLNKDIDPKVKGMMKKAMDKVINDMTGVPNNGSDMADGDPDSKGGEEFVSEKFAKEIIGGTVTGKFKMTEPNVSFVDPEGKSFDSDSLDAAAKKLAGNTNEKLEGLIMGESMTVSQPTKAQLKKKMVLKNATSVGQNVKGTSGHSVYIAVAIHPNIKLAVRYTDDDLSMRVEGKGTQQYADRLAALKFGQSGEGHWSAHLKVPNQWEVHKIIGAVIFGLQVDWVGVQVNLGKITDWGN